MARNTNTRQRASAEPESSTCTHVSPFPVREETAGALGTEDCVEVTTARISLFALGVMEPVV
jgi:uncharacterized UBP type Zn finger protein